MSFGKVRNNNKYLKALYIYISLRVVELSSCGKRSKRENEALDQHVGCASLDSAVVLPCASYHLQMMKRTKLPRKKLIFLVARLFPFLNMFSRLPSVARRVAPLLRATRGIATAAPAARASAFKFAYAAAAGVGAGALWFAQESQPAKVRVFFFYYSRSNSVVCFSFSS